MSYTCMYVCALLSYTRTVPVAYIHCEYIDAYTDYINRHTTAQCTCTCRSSTNEVHTTIHNNCYRWWYPIWGRNLILWRSFTRKRDYTWVRRADIAASHTYNITLCAAHRIWIDKRCLFFYVLLKQLANELLLLNRSHPLLSLPWQTQSFD